MGGASKFIMLLTTAPFPYLLRPALFLRLPRRVLSTSNTARHLAATQFPLLTPIKSFSSVIHTQSTAATHNNNNTFYVPVSHPWPEWSQVINSLQASSSTSSSEGQGFSVTADHSILPEDAFVVYEEKELSPDFVRAAAALLAFAHHNPNLLGMLSRRDIEVVVTNGTPFLFKTALETSRRLRTFLGANEGNALGADTANTVDLMKYIISYASNPSVSSERTKIYSRELVESSVRNLLQELAGVNSRDLASNQPAEPQNQFPFRYGETPRPPNQNIVMKRGDWICSKCNFMNFARNNKCLECEEPRPKRILIGGEWECPQCDFLNYGRNTVCLRCDCKRPGPAPASPVNSMSVPGYSYHTNNPSRLAENRDKAQWSYNASDISGASADEDFPEIMPLRRGENKFVVSTRKTPLERRQANAPNGDAAQPVGASENHLDAMVKKSLDNILGRSSSGSTNDVEGFTSVQNIEAATHIPERGTSVVSNQTGFVSIKNESGEKENSQLSENSEIQYGNKNKEKEQEDKSERWFQRMAELHNVKDLPSAVSDEDFPEIMPQRKGENRFVVSKKKDRSLTSPINKRKMAMEQASSTKYVPFVPFPPGYFARTEPQQPDGSASSTKSNDDVFTNPNSVQRSAGLDYAGYNKNDVIDINSTKNENTSSPSVGKSLSGDQVIPSTNFSAVPSHPPNAANVGEVNISQPKKTVGGMPNCDMQKEDTSPSLGHARDSCSEDSMAHNTFRSMSSTGDSLDLPTNQSEQRGGWTGKSLEGSAVKDPDPLDMSEEAKAERWFRRVAQIKDISELSQIPDEDFPSIMPMRKGVNRFVVSKRKTPMERRLTSPQYRRNLPVVSSEPLRKDNDTSETN